MDVIEPLPWYRNRYHINFLVRRYPYAVVMDAAVGLAYGLRWLLPRDAFRLHRPIFLVGCSRSGTTVFLEHLARHPDLCNWSEGAQVLEPRFYDPDIDHVRAGDDATQYRRFRMALLFRLKTRVLGKSRFVNKHPENSFRIDYLRAAFPDCLFVHVIRDGLSTVESNMRLARRDGFRHGWPFGQLPKPPGWRELICLPEHLQYAWQWRLAVSSVRERLGGDRPDPGYLEVRYEEFCEDPKGSLAKVELFCGLAPGASRLAWTPLPVANGRWRRSLSRIEIREIEEVIGPLQRALGYPASDALPATASA